MTIIEFKKLDFNKQADAVWQYGVFLDERVKGEHSILLYQIGAFYVEVFILNIKSRTVGLKCFNNTEELTPYLEKIDISELFQI